LESPSPAAGRHLTLPEGFRAAGVRCGLKQTGEDLALVAAEADVPAALLTTRNQVVGEPIKYCRSVLPRGCGRMRGIVINSGCSNVCTGPAGRKDAEEMARRAADRLQAAPERMLVASTGIIGHRLDMEKIRRGIDLAADELGTGNDDACARAILTTDTRIKTCVAIGELGGRAVTVAGIAKGSGMIAPSMATMISVLTTDATCRANVLRRCLREAADASFHAVTIDSDTSTSDTVAVFASGRAGNPSFAADSADGRRFAGLLRTVCEDLARQIAADGEGATRLVEVRVAGAHTPKQARIAAKAVADSPLVKCAIHGADPNWGRIAAALGKSAAKLDPDRLKIAIGGKTLLSGGRPRSFVAADVCEAMQREVVRIDCDLGCGEASYTALTCDLSREYIAINADYHT
jgi:glutamate N-acetyltransferase/amino-acid N-acetyltransferase